MSSMVDTVDMKNTALLHELQAIASVELADVLASWDALSPDQAQRLCAYLTAEMGEGGLLSLSHLREIESPARVIRNEARKVLARA